MSEYRAPGTWIATFSGAVLLAVLPFDPIRAQTAATDSAAGETHAPAMTEVIVTARKTSERLQDVPVAVSVVEGSFIEDRGIREIREAAQFVPGFSYRTDHSQRAFTGFRGIGTQGGGSQPSLAVFVDGVYQPGGQFFSQPLFDVERIEFLKGPQGTLYGRNTLGGAINIITRRPAKEWGGEVELGIANADTRSVKGMLNAPLGEHAILRLAAVHEESNGFQRNTFLNDWALSRDVDALRGTLLLQPTDRLEATLSAYFVDQVNGANGYAVVQRPDEFVRDFRGNDRPITDFNAYGAALHATYSFTPQIALTSISAYDRMVSNKGVFDIDYSPLPVQRFETEPNPKSISQELRLASQGAGPVNWIAGLFWSRERPVTLSRFFLNGAQIQDSRQESEFETRAAFANVTLRPIERWEFVAGLRYDDVKLQQAITQLNLPLSAANPFFVSGTESALQPKVTATYFWNPDFMTYASFARGYRGGGFNSALAPADRRTFSPEHTRNYEIGAKSQFLDKRALLNVSLYFIRQDDAQQNQIIQGLNGATINATSNAGEVESKGIEIEGALIPVEGLKINASFSYNDAQIVASPTPSLVGTYTTLSERKRLVIGANYERQLTSKVQAYGGVTYSGAGPISFNVSEQPYYSLVDLQAGVRLSDRYDVLAYANNVFDQKYQVIYSFQQILQSSGALSLIGDPRTYGLRLRAKW